MTSSARSVFVFSVYLILLGATIVVVPNLFLSVFGIPPTTEVWIRVVGMLVTILGFYYLQSARHGLVPFFRATLLGRTAVLVFFIAYVVLGFAPPILILFGLIDVAGAIWTALCLRGESSAGV
jgi:hypothetical protein